jgi:hypothetical protein
MTGRRRRRVRIWFTRGRPLLYVGWMLAACGVETRGWVLSERDAAGTPPSAIDAGCATCGDGVVLVGQSPTPLHGSQGGDGYTDLCRDDEVAIGYLGSIGDVSASAVPLLVITSLEAVCGAPRADGTGEIRIARSGTLPLRGVAGEVASWSQLCPTDQAIVAIEGRAGVALDRIGFACAGFAASSVPDGGTLAIASATALTPQGGDGGSAFAEACPPGEVARGHRLRAGQWIDAFGLVCGALGLAASE